MGIFALDVSDERREKATIPTGDHTPGRDSTASRAGGVPRTDRHVARSVLLRLDYDAALRVVARMHRYVEDLLDELIQAMASEGHDMTPRDSHGTCPDCPEPPEV